MSSPIPPDPYEALGVAKDADTSAVKIAHRKLVLKHHPDRIQDPALKDKGKETFQKIQQAYELLVDPIRRQRYDDRIKLAELRKEAMMSRGDRGDTPIRSQTYPMRPAPPPAANSREYSADDGAYFETRRPRNAEYESSKERFEEPMRNTSRKHETYDRTSSSKKPAEKTERSSTSKSAKSWTKAFTAVNAGIRISKEAEKTRSSKTQENKDRERRKDRMDKEQDRYRRPHIVSEDDSDSDTATRVTDATIRPSRPQPRHAASEQSTSRSSPSTRPTPRRAPTYGDEDSEESDTVSPSKWESHHAKTMEYLEKAQATVGKRPSLPRHESGSYWTRRSGDDYESRPSSKHGHEESPRARPSMPTQNSAPSNLKPRVDERSPRDRRSGPSPKEPAFDHRKEMPSFSRSQTMPTRSAGRKDAAPSKSSGLKHTETHDSGYGSSSSPHTNESRDESPAAAPRRSTRQNATRYQIVEPDSEDDNKTRIHRMDSDSEPRRRRYASPEQVDRRYRSPEPERRRDRGEKPERPHISTHTRAKSSRDATNETPKVRRGDSARESPRDSPTSRHPTNNSRDKLFREMSTDDVEQGYRHGANDKSHVRPAYAGYQREASDLRSRDYAPSSHFPHTTTSRRPSVYA